MFEQKGVVLTPSEKIPWLLILLSAPVIFLHKWGGLTLTGFGLFLWFQAQTIRLVFKESGLQVLRSDREIRFFPYVGWQSWQIFSDRIPVLFYFREVKSIHFLPIIFDPLALRANLEKYCSSLGASGHKQLKPNIEN
ncbi:MAG: DUF3119 family protein [Cyanobacteria bacterium P01_H01_bin.15]